ncbi:unnamed protein product, partial [Discosporangium mesarthrocarpum]
MELQWAERRARGLGTGPRLVLGWIRMRCGGSDGHFCYHLRMRIPRGLRNRLAVVLVLTAVAARNGPRTLFPIDKEAHARLM